MMRSAISWAIAPPPASNSMAASAARKVRILHASGVFIWDPWVGGNVLRLLDAGCIDEHELRVFDCDHADAFDPADRGTVPCIDGHAVNLDRAFGRHQVAVTACARELVFGRPALLDGGAEHARVGTDR